ncbi:Phenylacetic acid catabolic protein, partial [Klebsiella pneumoniae]|uniref:Phenylacetic acid catabolic protein n=1 Tax=Klebsiella pneumoniae TaxID=573 RepID=UPI00301356BF
RMKQAVEDLAPYIDELFDGDDVTAAMADAGIAPEPASSRAEFDRTVATIFAEAFLDMPTAPFAQRGGRSGRHGEAMGFLLADL